VRGIETACRVSTYSTFSIPQPLIVLTILQGDVNYGTNVHLGQRFIHLSSENAASNKCLVILCQDCSYDGSSCSS
jgi:hypothetical protein